MDVEGPIQPQFFELKALKNDPRAVGIVLLKKINMVGKSVNCDLCLNVPGISNIHAVVEVRGNKGLVYDMNTKSGTKINGKKIEGSCEFKVGDVLSFAGVEFKFQIYGPDDAKKFKLDILGPEKNQNLLAETKKRPKSGKSSFPFIVSKDKAGDHPPPPPDLPLESEETTVIEFKKRKIPKKPRDVFYPLAKDPKADFNEYIFEDIEYVHPIFDYDVNYSCVEVMILFNDDMFSVDYLPINKDGPFYLKGYKPKSNEVEYAPVGKRKRKKVVEIEKEKAYIYPLEGFTMLFLQDETSKIKDNPITQKESQEKIHLKESGIVRFHKEDVQIFIRKVEGPPKVTPAPFISKDSVLFKKYIGPVIAAFLLVFTIFLLIDVKPKKKEERDVKRLVRILKRPKPKKKNILQAMRKTKDKTESKKTPDKKPKDDKVIGKKNTKSTKNKIAKSGKKNKPSRKRAVKKVEKYKAVNFKSSLTSLLSKSKAASTAAVKKSKTKVNNLGSTSFIGKAAVDKLKRATVNTNVGSLEGISSGKLDSSISAAGLAKKGGIFVADIPTKTIVKGSIDPNVILQILREHLPQFRHCYQRELEKGNKKRFEGVVSLDFRIGATGNVTKAKVFNRKGKSSKGMNRCVAGVLKGIRFPRPKGGGVVDVVQSINFNIAGR